MLASYGEQGPYASDAAHWCIAPPVVDPRFLDVALNDESGLESSVCLLLEDEARDDDLLPLWDAGDVDQFVDVVLLQAIHFLLNCALPIFPLGRFHHVLVAVEDFEGLISLFRDSFVSGSSGGVDESSRRGKWISIQVSKIRSICLYHEA